MLYLLDYQDIQSWYLIEALIANNFAPVHPTFIKI